MSASYRNGPSHPVGGNDVYERLKAAVIDYEFPAGSRLAIEHLAERFAVSATPIREALIRLARDELIIEIPKAGFFMKEISEIEIASLYNAQWAWLERPLKSLGDKGRRPGILKPPDFLGPIRSGDITPELAARIMDDLLLHIARQSGNPVYISVIPKFSDRTRYVRKKDHEISGDPDAALPGLCRAYHEQDFACLHGKLGAHFEDGTKRLPDLIRLLRGSCLKRA